MSDQLNALRGRRDALLQMCSWQDSLLQSYRSINLTLQSFLLVVLVASVAIPSELDLDKYGPFHVVSLVVAIAVLGTILVTSTKLQNIIIARGNDVSYVHREIIDTEAGLPAEERVFTAFKVAQGNIEGLSQDQAEATFLSDGKVSQDDIGTLVDGRLGFARRTIDRNLFDGVRVAAVLLVIAKVSILAVALVL